MADTVGYLANAERLLSDAECLHTAGRSRSASTLIVVALEQMGEFVEALTRQTYPDADVHMGIFGAKANAHAKRQDALAGHVMNYAFGAYAGRIMAKRLAVDGVAEENVVEYMLRTQPHHFTDEEQALQGSCPDIEAAQRLMHYVRSNMLRDLREFGLYENNNRTFSTDEIAHMLELASRVRGILRRSWVTPEPFGLVGVNIPEGAIPGGL
ncbi:MULTISPECIES: hypothetical protein [Bradyrhizobium]|uniref:AbiV family abortive infection protein n=1 Tax=Bradyrhizobium elkanii TaxID=29448 RepID=A0A4U6S523_BRAEL|nr:MULTISPECIES: hypothetical protein [Bradyrhizobium]MTV12501.1 hypothetical protein [Bradyrhizobium sp. BR2003]TKV82211.1 hypothetical protein FDV58_06835 [Bradyrhizobium elkanii]